MEQAVDYLQDHGITALLYTPPPTPAMATAYNNLVPTPNSMAMQTVKRAQVRVIFVILSRQEKIPRNKMMIRHI